MALREWRLRPQNTEVAKAIAEGCSLGDLSAKVLAARGYETPQQVSNLILCEQPLESPLVMKDMDKAAQRIRDAIEAGETIAIFGDYDVDGITATALMYSYLTSVCESDILLRLPERKTEGYGLSSVAVTELAMRGAGLIITVDNGIAAYDEIELANSLGVDVIVCDHHMPPEKLPNAVAVVDPNRSDCQSSFKELAGVGVALKLAAAVEDCPVEQMADYFGYFAALGTVADVVPLVSENRYLVKTGIEQIQQGANVGISALLELASIPPERVDARSISFGIAPRLNAAGRIASANDSLSLLIDEENAEETAQKIDELNKKRRALEQDAEQAIQALFLADPSILAKPIIVVGDTGFSGGVVGIVASRLTERYGKPAIVYTDDGKTLKASCRSVDGFSIYDALSACSDCLEHFGGHPMAAGLSLPRTKLSQFVARLCEYCREHPVPHGVLNIDCEIAPNELNIDEICRLCELEPFGKGNEQPIFAVRGAVVEDVAPLAEKYIQYRLKYQGQSLKLADFSCSLAESPYRAGDTLDAAFIASINDVSNRSYLSLRAVELRAAEFSDSQFETVDVFSSLDPDSGWADRYSSIAITRQDVAVVYRALSEQRYNERDLTPLIVKCGLPAGKTLAAVRTLKELGLVSAGSLRMRKVAQKRELTDSPTFFFLNNGGN